MAAFWRGDGANLRSPSPDLLGGLLGSAIPTWLGVALALSSEQIPACPRSSRGTSGE